MIVRSFAELVGTILRYGSVGVFLIAGCGRADLEVERTLTPPPDRLKPLKHSSSHDRMLNVLSKISEVDRAEDAAALKDASQPIPSEATDLQKFVANRDCGLTLLIHGRNEDAVERYEQACRLMPRLRGQINKDDFVDTLLETAVAYLRIAETENCVACCNGASCLFPIAKAGTHKARRGSEKAIQYLEMLLKQVPNELRAGWLLNLAYMTLGEYPEGVPRRFRMKLKQPNIDSSIRFPKFTNVASPLGLDSFNLSGGAVCDDFDSDGDIDVITSAWDAAGQILYFENNGDGTFSDRTTEAGLEGIVGGLNLVHADYDNDNDLDVLVLRGAWLGVEEGRQPNSLLQNDGHGRFDDVAFSAGLAGEGKDFPTQTAAWCDFDRDGWLDLYVGNEQMPNQLFRNQKNGTFSDVAKSAGVDSKGFTKGVSWGDYDGDGDPDLYVSNVDSENSLYQNNDNGTFSDVAGELNVDKPIQSFPTWFWDYDNDGSLDLWVGSAWWDLRYFVADYVGVPHDGETQRLYRGDGKGGFEEVSEQAKLAEINMPMGSNFGDLDNDGFLDFYLGTGFPNFNGLMPNVMYRNLQGKKFDDVTFQGGFGHLQKGHAISFADLDNDGDQDVFSQMGGAYPADGFYNAVYKNPGFGNSFARIRLEGVRSNRYGLGAKIRVYFNDAGETRCVHFVLNAGSSFGANPLAPQIGLGKANSIERIVVEWPFRASQDSYENLPVNSVIHLTEGQQKFDVRKMKATSLKEDVQPTK